MAGKRRKPREFPDPWAGLCPWHKPSRLPYSAAFDDADERIANGEEQTFCPTCKRWYWPHEIGTPPTLTIAWMKEGASKEEMIEFLANPKSAR